MPNIYYRISSNSGGGARVFRVPTYGMIMKIIDFGRATFRPPGAEAPWISDAYAPDADAGGQYNCGRYMETGEPRVDPNPSFDLCRLAVAMLDSLWGPGELELREPRRVLTQEPGRTQYETVSPLWNLMWLWLTDRDGRNVLRTPTGRERYPEFDLHCAIARDIVNAVPAQQLTLPLFDEAFRVTEGDVPVGAMVWGLQAIVPVSPVSPVVPVAEPALSAAVPRGQHRSGGRGQTGGRPGRALMDPEMD